MPDRDDKALTDDQVCLAVSNLFADELCGPQHDEQSRVVDIQLWTLVSLMSILDHQLVQAEVRL